MSSKSRFSVALTAIAAFVAVAALASPATAVVFDDFNGPTIDPSWIEIDGTPGVNTFGPGTTAPTVYTQVAVPTPIGVPVADQLTRLIGDDSSWTATLVIDNVAFLSPASSFNFNFGDPGFSHSFILTPGSFFYNSTADAAAPTVIAASEASLLTTSTITVSWLDPDGPGASTGAFTVSGVLGTTVPTVFGPTAMPTTSLMSVAGAARTVNLTTVGFSPADFEGVAVISFDSYGDDSSTGAGLATAPEPSALVLALFGLLGLACGRRRRRS